MSPTESSILSNFLLPPAPLPAVITLSQFTDLFPTAQRSDPQIAILYRELQHQRAMDTDDVKRNIAAEVKRGELQRREVIRSRRREDRQQVEGLEERELQMDFALSGPHANAPPRPEHTLKTIIPELEDATAALEREIAAIRQVSAQLYQDAQGTIGDLSDLRYGRFNRASGASGDLSDDVMDKLQMLENVFQQVHNR